MAGYICISKNYLERSIQTMWQNKFDPTQITLLAKEVWAKWGATGKFPPLPEEMAELLMKPCLFHPTKLTGHTHLVLLVLNTTTVNGKQIMITLNLMKNRIAQPQKTTVPQFVDYAPSVQQALGDVEIANPYWAMITEEVIPGSQDATYEEQQKLIEEQGRGDYELPSAREAATMAYVYECGEANQQSSDSAPPFWTYTRCKETIQEDPVVVKTYTYIADILKGCISTESLFERPTNPLIKQHSGALAIRRFVSSGNA